MTEKVVTELRKKYPGMKKAMRALVKEFKRQHPDDAQRVVKAMLAQGLEPAFVDQEIARAILGCIWEMERGYPDRLAEVLEALAAGHWVETLFPDALYATKPGTSPN
jgi:hypothetical protein